MTIGDKSAQSYGWGLALKAPVKDGEGVKIPTPGIDQRYTDTEHADVTVASTNKVFKAGDSQIDLAFDMTEGAESVDVNNHTGQEWPLGDQVYVYCPHLLAEGDNEWDLKGQIWDLQQRVSALEEAQTGSEASKSAKEPAKSPIEPPKAPPAPVRAAIPPAKPPNSPQRAPIAPPRGR
jgi:hypothetical protein